jgi:hypothetical protein
MTDYSTRRQEARRRAIERARERARQMKQRYLQNTNRMNVVTGPSGTEYQYYMQGRSGNTWVYSVPMTVGDWRVHITLEIDRSPVTLHFTVEDEPALEQMHVWYVDGRCTGDNCDTPGIVRDSAYQEARDWIDEHWDGALQDIAEDFTAGVKQVLRTN